MKTIKHNPVSLLTTYYGKNQNNFKFNIPLSTASVDNVFYPTQISNEKNYHLAVNFFNFNSIGKFYKNRGKLLPLLNMTLTTSVSNSQFNRQINSNQVELHSEKMLINGSIVEYIGTPSSFVDRLSPQGYSASPSQIIHDISNNYYPSADNIISSVMTYGTANTLNYGNSHLLLITTDNASRQYHVAGHQLTNECLGLNLRSYYNTFENECLDHDQLTAIRSSILGKSTDWISNPDENYMHSVPFMNSNTLRYSHFALSTPSMNWNWAGGIPAGQIYRNVTSFENIIPLTYNYESKEARFLIINSNLYIKNAASFSQLSYDLIFKQFKLDSSITTMPTLTPTDSKVIQPKEEIANNMNYNVGFSRTLKNEETFFSVIAKEKICALNIKRTQLVNKEFFKDIELLTGLTFELKVSRLYSRFEFEFNKDIELSLISLKDRHLFIGNNQIKFYDSEDVEIYPLEDISVESFIIKFIKTNQGFDIFINDYKSTLIIDENDLIALYGNGSLIIGGVLTLDYAKLYDNNETIDEILTERELNEIKQTDAQKIPNYKIKLKSAFDVHISPTGDDTTGNGSYNNPWKTLKNCQRGQTIGLLPGIYSDAANAYGQVVNIERYYTLHGLFYNAFTTPDYSRPNSRYVMSNNLRNGVTGFSGRTGESIFISAVELNTVTISMSATSSRDYSLFNGWTDAVLANITVQASRGKVHGFSASYSRFGEFVLFVNMQFRETGYYSLQYGSVYTSSIVGYVNCTFTGTRLGNYFGNPIEVLNTSLNNEVKPKSESGNSVIDASLVDHQILRVLTDIPLKSNRLLYNDGKYNYFKLLCDDLIVDNYIFIKNLSNFIFIDRFEYTEFNSSIFDIDETFEKIQFTNFDDVIFEELVIINSVETYMPIIIDQEYLISEFKNKKIRLKSDTKLYNVETEISFSMSKISTRIVEDVEMIIDEDGNESELIIEREEEYVETKESNLEITHNLIKDALIQGLNSKSKTFTFTDPYYVFNKYENKLKIKSNNFNLDSMNIKDYVVSNINELKLFSNDTDMHDINTLLYTYDDKKYCVIFNGTCDKHDVYLLEIKKYQDVSYIPDPDATQPEDWVVEYDEEGNEILWEAPLIPIYSDRTEFEFIDSLLNTVRKPLPANENDHSTYLFLYYDSDNLMKIRRLYLTDKIETFETNISNEFNQKLIPHAFKFEKYDTMDQLLVNMYKVGDEFRLLVNTNFNDNYGRVNTEDRISYIYNLKKDIFVETEIVQVKTTSIIKDENDQDIEVEVLTNEFILTGIVENIFKEKLVNSTITLNIFDDSKSILVKDENDNFINYGKSDIVIHTDFEAKFELNIKIESDISQVKNYFDNAKFIFKIYKFLDAYTFTNNILREI